MKHTISRRRLFFTKNLIMMLVMVVVVIMAISAWFSLSKTVTADGIEVKADSTEIDIAPAIKTYNADRTVKTDGPGEFTDKLIFNGEYIFNKDCTGDGETLIVPEFNVTKDFKSVKQIGKEVNLNLDPDNAKSNIDSENYKLLHPDQDAPEYQYIQCEFYVRSKNPVLELDAQSQLLSRTEKNNGSLSTEITDANNSKKSAYGNFNVDGLVGAMRVALIGEGCTYVNQNWTTSGGVNTVITTGDGAPTTIRNSAEKQLLWLPRPDVYLNIPNDDRLDNWTLHTNVASNSDEGRESYKHSYYKRKASGSGVELVENDNSPRTKISSGTNSGHPSLGTNVNISDFTYSDELETLQLVESKASLSDKKDYYVTKYTMKIWIEGTDKEARRAMDGGEFDLKLSFL